MDKPYAVLPQAEAVKTVTWIFEHLASSPCRTPEALRNAILGDGGIAINPMLDIKNEIDAMLLKDMIHRAIAEGRMIDLGYLPNTVIKAEATRARDMFEAGELIHPYDSWVATTSWEGGLNGYYLCPHPQWEGAVLVIEMYGVQLPNGRIAILLYDMVSIKQEGPAHTIVSPAFMSHKQMMTEEQLRARGSNSLDPLVIMLRLLADASIPVVPKPAPMKLNKARQKHGKYLIPGHTQVQTKDYVAHFLNMTSKVRSEAKGGHHASPVAHWRRSHMRHLTDGRVVQVRSAKINWRDNEELHRMLYKL